MPPKIDNRKTGQNLKASFNRYENLYSGVFGVAKYESELNFVNFIWKKKKKGNCGRAGERAKYKRC